MRIISGKHRGRKLAEFAGGEIRPTADRVKEALFNSLADRVAGACALDLFCGSGSLGLECISRGAERVMFNDRSAQSLAVLRRNLNAIGEGARARITNMDYLAALSSYTVKFDLIFIDPPYREEYGIPALEVISERGLLSSGGVAVYERDRAFAGSVSGLKITDERKYGKTFLTFFEREE